MAQTAQVVPVVLLTVVFVALLAVFLASVLLQMKASETYTLTQELFPALQAAGYEYWLDFGTLLGAAREKTMIVHDYDADIGMRESEFQRLKSNWASDSRFQGMRLTQEKDDLYKVRRGRAYVDIFRYDDITQPKHGTLRLISQGNLHLDCACRQLGEHAKGHTVPAADVFPLTLMQFGGVTAPAPRRSHEYLTHWYGSNWHVPRRTGKSTIIGLTPYWWRRR